MFKRKMITLYDEKLWKDFENFVIETYGIKYSFYGLELEKAIKYHLATMGYKEYYKIAFPGENGKTVESDIDHTHKLRGNVKTLYLWVLEQDEGDHVPFKSLRKIMISECGVTDIRTHKKYIDILVSLNVLKQVGRDKYLTYEIMKLQEYDYYDSIPGEVI